MAIERKETMKNATLLAMMLCAGAVFADSATDSAIRMEEVGVAVFGHPDFTLPVAASTFAPPASRPKTASNLNGSTSIQSPLVADTATSSLVVRWAKRKLCSAVRRAVNDHCRAVNDRPKPERICSVSFVTAKPKAILNSMFAIMTTETTIALNSRE